MGWCQTWAHVWFGQMYVCTSDVEGFLLCLPDALMDLRSNQILAQNFILFYFIYLSIYL